MATVSGGSTSERFGFIQQFGQKLGVKYLCTWLQVSRSGYYAWLKRPISLRVKADVGLLEHINRVFIANRQTYGSPRVFQTLKREGILIEKTRYPQSTFQDLAYRKSTQDQFNNEKAAADLAAAFEALKK